MAHMLARLRGVKLQVIEEVLKHDAPEHAKEGLHMEHRWQNVDDDEEATSDAGATNVVEATHALAPALC